MQSNSPHNLSRRRFLMTAGGLAAGLGLMPGRLNRLLSPVHVAEAADREPDLYWAGTDGWIHLPDLPAIPPFFPDNYAPAPFNTYIFGFRNITGLTNYINNGRASQAAGGQDPPAA